MGNVVWSGRSIYDGGGLAQELQLLGAGGLCVPGTGCMLVTYECWDRFSVDAGLSDKKSE